MTKDKRKYRIVHKHDIEVNWNKATEFIPEQAELIIYDDRYIDHNGDVIIVADRVRYKIGDGVTKIKDLPFIGEVSDSGNEDAHVYEATIAKGEDHTTAITTALNGAEPNTRDVAIIKEAIIDQKIIDDAAEEEPPKTIKQVYQYTAYRWNGVSWIAFDGNYSAKNVILDSDFTFTAPVGVITQKEINDNKGSTTREAAGKSIQDFLAGIFAKETYPSRTSNTSVSWTTEPKGTVEVGTEVTPTYNAKLNAGSYTYGPATGITATSWDIDVADLSDDNKSTNSGTFSKFIAVDGMSGYAKVTAKATYGDGAIPVTNIGNKYDEDGSKNIRIMSGSKSATSAGYTSYRAWFYGYKAGGSTLTIADIDSDDIRELTSANGSFTSSMNTTNMQQMFFAAPAGLVDNVSVAHSVNGAPQTVKKTIVYVKGNNNYVVTEENATEINTINGMKYDLFYVSNDNANTGDATYTITVTLVQ